MLKHTFLFISLLGAAALAHSQSYYFRHYEVESGLSNNAVICSIQDPEGYMWFGTRDGLNRFDGQGFKVYNFSGHRYESNGNNFVHALHVDEEGILWVATEKDIYTYHAASDSFSYVISSKSFPLDEIQSDRKGNIWFVSGGVLSKYIKEKKTLQVYEPKDYFFATSVSLGHDGVLWASSANGTLERYDEKSDSFEHFDLFKNDRAHAYRWIDRIHCSDNGEILVGTVRAPLKIFNTKTLTHRDIQLCCEKEENLFIRTFLEWPSGELWIGTETGLFIYDRNTGKSKRLEKRPTDQYSLSDNVIYTLSRDKEGGIWAGTYFGGINYYPRQYTPFEKFYHKSHENSLSGNVVREIRQDKLGNMWISTEDGGLNKLDTNGIFTHFKPDDKKPSISYISVHSLMPLGDILWVGTYEHGLDLLDIKTGQIVKHYSQSSKNGLNTNFLFCFYETKQKEVLVGSISGIYRYDAARDYFNPLEDFPQNRWYMCILEDAEGTIWTGISGEGLYYQNKKTGKSGRFGFDPADETSIASNKVNTIFEDSKKRLWFATENGLCRWNAATRNFSRYGTNNGFPTNFMLSILEDEKNQLWISTTKGLVCFDPETEKTWVYTTANGLLSDQFNFSSAYKDKDNKMYFGSAKGLVAFHPSTFSQSNFSPPIHLTGFQINNQEVKVSPEGTPLQQAITYTNKLELKHNQSSFSIAFAALTYSAPEMVQYAYKLEGLSEDWVYVGNSRRIFFTNLTSGKYTLKMKSTNSSGVWQPEQTKLSIYVLPPWWLSWWAYTIYGALAIGLICYALYTSHQRIENRNKRKIELLALEQERELIQLEVAKEKEHIKSKVDFLTNVAHEIRTPLTLIKIPLRKVVQRTNELPEVQSSLKIISNNTERLIELTNQLLDFRQIEIKEFHLSFTNENISELINEVSQNFRGMADEKGMEFSIILPEEPVYASIDIEAFIKILYNLFSNAVKYGKRQVSVELLPCEQVKTTFIIRVKNDGFLIPYDFREKIFEPFYRIKETKTEKGTGIGLTLAQSLAKLHKGDLILEKPEHGMNVFALSLPVYQKPEAPIENKSITNDNLAT